MWTIIDEHTYRLTSVDRGEQKGSLGQYFEANGLIRWRDLRK